MSTVLYLCGYAWCNPSLYLYLFVLLQTVLVFLTQLQMYEPKHTTQWLSPKECCCCRSNIHHTPAQAILLLPCRASFFINNKSKPISRESFILLTSIQPLAFLHESTYILFLHSWLSVCLSVDNNNMTEPGAPSQCTHTLKHKHPSYSPPQHQPSYTHTSPSILPDPSWPPRFAEAPACPGCSPGSLAPPCWMEEAMNRLSKSDLLQLLSVSLSFQTTLLCSQPCTFMALLYLIVLFSQWRLLTLTSNTQCQSSSLASVVVCL